MAIIRTLGVAVKAKTTNFDKGMKGVRKGLVETESRFRKAAKAAAAFSAALAAGLAFATVKMIDAIDEQKKFASRIGISFEALQEFQFANEKAGNSVNVLNLGLQRMSRRIAEASQGMGEAQTALVELGLDAVALAKLPLEDQFKLIADSLDGVKGSSDKTRLAFKLFDSEGVALINTIKGGSAALEEQGQRARELGIIVSNLDAQGIERLQDVFTETKAVLKGIGTRILVELTAPLKALGEVVLAVIEGFNTLFGFSKDPADTFKAAADRAKAAAERSKVATGKGAPGDRADLPRGGGLATGQALVSKQFENDGKVSREAIQKMLKESEKQTKVLTFIGDNLRTPALPGVGG